MNAALPDPGDDERAHSEALAAAIRDEIAATGPMPFSRFMERCLYAPGLGYYSAGRTRFGAAGDFVTAPELGSLFAATIAASLAPTLRALGPRADFLEIGGGSGAFAETCIGELAALDVLPRRYAILEPSADLRERQRRRLGAALPAPTMARVEWLDRPPHEPWRGVLFANEVVDALPVTRFAIDAGAVFEEHVVLRGEDFARVNRPADALIGSAVREAERDLEAPFADGYRSEILPQLPYWIAAVMGMLTNGHALFVDYGYPRREYYLPERRDGTLVCHYRHRAHADPLILPGLQDLTAFVDFTALAQAGHAAGFALAGYFTQARFLLGSGLSDRFTRLVADADDITRYRLAQEVRRLTLPADMGERFQVIAFARGIDHALPDVQAYDLSRRL
ncbi:MAG TPA: SAM-dependent methyltransferase [Rhodanobacteraceae bacterium]|nr:SAM-dependent methyltransferase [Rhodanobacteraceae bacterium]